MAKPKAGQPSWLSIHFLLDASGSMADIKEAVVAAFNEFMVQLQSVASPPELSLETFAWNVRKIMERRPAYECPVLEAKDYMVGGGTELYDAVGKAFAKLDATGAERKVLVVLTDGEDGGPGKAACAALIAEKQAAGYGVVFLATGAGAKKEAKALNVEPSMVMNFSSGKLSETMMAAARAVLEFGHTGDAKKAGFSDAERKRAK